MSAVFVHNSESCEEGSIRLRGSASSFGGRVELCIELTWTTICDGVWDNRDASVACRQLGFSPHGIAYCDCVDTIVPMLEMQGQLLFPVASQKDNSLLESPRFTAMVQKIT